MYYISAKTFDEAFGYSRNSIFHFTKIGQKKELIKKYNIHYGKIDFMLDEKENKFYKVTNFNKNEILDEIKFGMKYRFNFENKNSLIGEFIIFNKFDKTLLLVVKDDKEKFYQLNLDEIYDIKKEFFMKIEKIQNTNKMNNNFYNKNNVLNKENKKKDNDSFRNIFNNIANKKDE